MPPLIYTIPPPYRYLLAEDPHPFRIPPYLSCAPFAEIPLLVNITAFVLARDVKVRDAAAAEAALRVRNMTVAF